MKQDLRKNGRKMEVKDDDECDSDERENKRLQQLDLGLGGIRRGEGD